MPFAQSMLDPPPTASLLDDCGRPVLVSARGDLSSLPVTLRSPALPNGGGVVTAFAGPWAQDVRWWDRTSRARRVTWQVVVDETLACLVNVERGAASITAVYD